MKSLFLAWQAPENTSHSRAWFPIGRLDAEPESHRYLVEDLVRCVPFAPELSAVIAKTNSEAAPYNQRILIDYAGRAPEGHEPMTSPDFQPLVS